MSEFTFLFRGRDLTGSPEQMQKHLEKWLQWFKDLGAKGYVRDAGHPLEADGRVVKGVRSKPSDGPYAEAKDIIGGYMLIEANDLDHAADIAQGCPILEVGGSVEVRKIQKVNY